MTALLAATHVSAGYGRTPVVEGVSFSLADGRTLGVVGPNATGKSTLLRVLIGLLAPSSGEVRLDGALISEVSHRQRAQRIAMVPQSVRFDIDFSVREIVALGRSPQANGWGLETPEDREIVARALAELELDSLSSRPFAELSGGERQRVLLARVVAQQAAIWLLDEPTAHLDLAHQLLVMEQIESHRANGGAAVVVLHDLPLAMRLDEVLVLDCGKVVAVGQPAEVLTPARLAATWGIDGTLEQRDGAWSLALRGRTKIG